MKFFSRSFFILFLTLNFFTKAKAQTRGDSNLLALQEIEEKNNLLRTKDSIRVAVLKEELNTLINPKSKELERYKTELQKIRRDDSLRQLSQQQSVNMLRNKISPHPVKLFNDRLFQFYGSLGPFSSQVRATNAAEQIHKLYDTKNYIADSLKTEKKDDFINLVYKKNIITSISLEDALWEGKNQDSLAVSYVKAINKSIEHNRQLHTKENTIIRWLSAAGIVAGFFVVTWLINRLYRILFRFILRKKNRYSDGIKVKNYQMLSPIRLIRFGLKLLAVLRVALILVSLAFALSFLFSIFPATETLAYRLLGYTWEPLKDLGISLYHYLPRLFRIVVVLIIGMYIDRFFRFISNEIKLGNLRIKGFHRDWAVPTYKLVRLCLVGFTLIIVFPLLPGSDTSAFKGISVFFGVLISLGSSSAISNTIAGFIITYMRPFQLGDWIKTNDITGEVIEKSALTTRFRTINNEDITIPNSTILTNKTINYSSFASEGGLVIPINININYDVPEKTVENILLQAAIKTQYILGKPQPYVFVNGLKDTYVNYQLNATTKHPDKMYFIISDLNENILKGFSEAGINILSPQFFPKPKD